MIPIKKGIESTGQPAVSIESGDSSIPRKPILVEGGPAPEPITVTPLSVTENGTYTAGENAAYNPITVNVASQMPSEYLESEYDLLNSNSTVGYYDSVKNSFLPPTRYRDFANGYITGRNGDVLLNIPNWGSVTKVVVKTGEFDRSIEPNEEWLNLMRMSQGDWHFNLTFNTSGNYWRVSDASGAEIDIPASTLPKYSFDNTTFEIIYGAKYINGELYRGIKVNGEITEYYNNKLFVYLNGNLVMENTTQEIFAEIRVGGGNGWIGAKFENVKIYDVTDVYFKYLDNNTQRSVKHVAKFNYKESEVE